MNVLSEVDEALKQWCHRVGSTLGIDNQDDRQLQNAGNLGRGPLIALKAIKEAHHTLYDTYISLFSIMLKEVVDMLRGSHEGVQVDARATTYCLVKLRVDIVGSAFEGLHTIALLREKSHQAACNGCLTTAAGRCCYEKCGLHTGDKGTKFFAKSSRIDDAK